MMKAKRALTDLVEQAHKELVGVVESDPLLHLGGNATQRITSVEDLLDDEAA
jgi:hypothetical protein